MKKWILRIVAVAVVLGIAAAIVIFINLNSIVKTGVETVGPKLTKVDVRLDAAKLSPFNGNGELSGLFVGNPEGFKTPSAIQVGNVKVAVKLSSALSDTIQIDEVNIQGPEITFEGGLGGNNLSQILENLEGSPDDVKPTPEAEPASEGGKKFFVKDLVVNGGKIHVSVTGMGGKSVTVPLPPIHLTNIGSEDNGVTAAQLCKQILEPIIASALKSGTEALAGIGTGLEGMGKDAADKAGKTLEGFKGLLKKKE